MHEHFIFVQHHHSPELMAMGVFLALVFAFAMMQR